MSENNNERMDNLQNQIVLMLKGVGVIEENELELKENINDIKENLFGDDDFSYEDFDDAETNHNTTFSQQGTFIRYKGEKSLTTKIDKMLFNNIINQGFRREKKFLTQNFFPNNSFNPIIQNNMLNDSFNCQMPNHYFIFNNNNFNIFNQNNQNSNLNINQYNNINHININNFNNNINMNNNNIPLISTPFGMKMPIRTFSFSKQQNNNINNILNLRNNLGKNIKHKSFYYQGKKENNINNQFIINENTSRELEMMLIKNGCFNKKVLNILKGKLISLMKTQQISRILQYYLENTPSNIIHLIFLEFKDELAELLLDIYANYFCSKIFFYLNDEDRIIFLHNISKKLDNLSINKISTYPIQCIIEKLDKDKEHEIIFNSIINNLMKLSIDVYGTHVLEKILSSFNYEKYLIHISNFILDNFVFLVQNSNGLCIVKKEIIIEYKRKNGNNFKRLKKLLIENTLILIENPFGNYALQIAVDNWELGDLKEIISSIKGKYLILSIQKYSSNVIERFINKSEEFLYNYIMEISKDDKSICLLMKNNYGNYVIQTALKASKNNKNIQNILINIINKNLLFLNDKKLINKWKNLISNNCVN